MKKKKIENIVTTNDLDNLSRVKILLKQIDQNIYFKLFLSK